MSNTMIRKLRKLAATSPKEIAFRARRALSVEWQHLNYRIGRYKWTDEQFHKRLCGHVADSPRMDSLSSWWRQHMRTRREPAFPLGPDELQQSTELYKQIFGNRLHDAAEKSRQIVAGRFEFLGISFQADDPIRWQKDPRTGREWPRTFRGNISSYVNHDSPGDPKHVWELNRHEFLVDCGKAFRLTNDECNAARVFGMIDSWITDNPFQEGINWNSPLEVAVRAIAWIWTYQFCRNGDTLPADSHLAFIKALYLHGYYLYRNLSFYISPYNHLIGESTALYLLGCFFPEFDEAERWRTKGWDVLCREVDNQFHEDGGSVEQATSYHHYCLGFYILAVLVRRRRGEEIPPSLLQRLEAALEFSMWMTQPDGTVPRIGDMDDARSIGFGANPAWDFRNILCLGALLFERPEFKQIAGPFHEDALWLCGTAGYRIWENLNPCPPASTTRLFARSGYCIMKDGWQPTDHHACFDCGPLAAGLHGGDVASAVHGHADLLSFQMCAYGQPLLVDGGFYTYGGDPDWHRYFREARAHNTVCVDGAAQARFDGMMTWSRVAGPGPVFSQCEEDYDFVECSHEGFPDATGPTRHRRAVFWKRPDYWIIFDRLEGRGMHDVEVFFHLSPCQIIQNTNHSVLSRHEDDVHLLLQSVGPGLLDLDIIQQGDGPDGGWIATSYGVRKRAPVIRFHGRLELPTTFGFVCIPSARTAPRTVLREREILGPNDEPITDALALSLQRDDRRNLVGFSWSPTGRKHIGSHDFDGRFFLHEETVNGKSLSTDSVAIGKPSCSTTLIDADK